MFLYRYMMNQQELQEVQVFPVSTEMETQEVVKKRKREEQEKGYVYVFSNPMYAYYGENVYKIGYSKEPEKRVRDFDTSYPEETTIVYTYKHDRARTLEQTVHKALDIFRLFPNREFSSVPYQRYVISSSFSETTCDDSSSSL